MTLKGSDTAKLEELDKDYELDLSTVLDDEAEKVEEARARQTALENAHRQAIEKRQEQAALVDKARFDRMLLSEGRATVTQTDWELFTDWLEEQEFADEIDSDDYVDMYDTFIGSDEYPGLREARRKADERQQIRQVRRPLAHCCTFKAVRSRTTLLPRRDRRRNSSLNTTGGSSIGWTMVCGTAMLSMRRSRRRWSAWGKRWRRIRPGS